MLRFSQDKPRLGDFIISCTSEGFVVIGVGMIHQLGQPSRPEVGPISGIFPTYEEALVYVKKHKELHYNANDIWVEEQG